MSGRDAAALIVPTDPADLGSLIPEGKTHEPTSTSRILSGARDASGLVSDCGSAPSPGVQLLTPGEENSSQQPLH